MFFKKCVLGKQEIDISSNTVAEIRNATEQELEKFADKHWKLIAPPFNESFWIELCNLLNNLEIYFFMNSSKDIEKYAIYSSIEKKLHFRKDIKEFYLDTKEQKIYTKTKANFFDSIDSIFYLFSNSSEQKLDEFGDPIIDEYDYLDDSSYSNPPKKTCDYPQDFWKLLCILGELLYGEFNDFEIKSPIYKAAIRMFKSEEKQEYGKNITEKEAVEKRIKSFIEVYSQSKIEFLNEKCKNRKNLLYFFNDNASYIAQFGSKVITYEETITEVKEFLNSSHRVLDVDGNIFFEFENDCGFDLDNKFSEIKKIQEKILNTMDSGEKNVEYTLRWILHNTDSYIVPIQKDCESKYRYNCILLRKSDFIDEPQEYDHILVSPAGIILIESKYWNGLVRYLPDGQLLRKVDGGDFCGENDTISQINRHMILMKKIAPNIPVYNVLCLAHNNVIIEGREFCDNFSIVSVNQLGQFIHKLCCDNRRYSNDQIDEIAKLINSCKYDISNINI